METNNKESFFHEAKRRRLFTIVETGSDLDVISRTYDIISVLMIVCNLSISIALTFDHIAQTAGSVLQGIELITTLFFVVDYVLRLYTAKCRYPNLSEAVAFRKYFISFMGIVDLLSFLPYFLPFFFPSGMVAFRLIRVIRIFRLFRISVYYDSLNVIAEVIISKRQQLLSSVFIILILMTASSLCMYSIEHEAQPDVFENAFSGIWWSVSTLLTVGYGDIYPITTLGRIFSIAITFLGVGMVAIPTGIISAGFVDQYSRAKRISTYGETDDVRFIKVKVDDLDGWCGKKIQSLSLPKGLLIAAIQRGGGVVVPRGEVILEKGDLVILSAAAFKDDQHIELKRVVLRDRNPWIGQLISDLDISRRTIFVMIRRGETVMVPRGDIKLQCDDVVVLYSKRRIADSEEFEV